MSTKQAGMNQKGRPPDEAGSEEQHVDVVFHGHISPNTNTAHGHANVHANVHHAHATHANDNSLQMLQLIKKARFDDMGIMPAYPLKSEAIHDAREEEEEEEVFELHGPDKQHGFSMLRGMQGSGGNILAYAGGPRVIGGGGYHCPAMDGDGFSRVVPASLPGGIPGGGPVSLTLGLQHPEGLVSPSLPAQHHHHHQQQQLFVQQQFHAAAGHMNSSSGSSSSSSSSADQLGGMLNHHHHHHHGGGEISGSTGGGGGGGVGNRRQLETTDVEQYYSGILDASRSYEAQLAELQARKRFASHMLHQG